MEYFFTQHLVIREWLNGALFPLTVFVSLMIARHLFLTWYTFGKGWTNQPGIQTACVLYWLFLAESIRAGIVWLILRSENIHDPIEKSSFWTNGLLIVCGLVLIATMLRCIYLFTPPNWGNRPWIVCAVFTFVFLLASQTLSAFG